MKRIASIDLLRALAIIGMVLSGQMLWHAELPRAMFHAQVPPPSFVFNPDVPGITWVDLVFPFFLFSMGASMPLALRRREEKGASWKDIFINATHRFVWLAAFALILGNTGMYLLKDLMQPWAASLLTLGVWILFFIMFIRLPKMEKKYNSILNWGGFAALICVTLLYKALGVNVSITHNNIIILILANMALFGTLFWWVTRNNLSARIVIIAAIATLKMASDIDGSWCQHLWQQSPAEWLFRFEFIKYLCLVLSGTVVGDIIQKKISCTDNQSHKPSSTTDKGWLSLSVVAMICTTIGILMWGLFVRKVELTVYLTLVTVIITWIMLKYMHTKHSDAYRQIYAAAMAFLVIGLIAEPMEGGIKKDPATIGYLFTTSAMAAMVLLATLMLEMRFNLRFKALEACGANPMFAYVASGYLLTPILTLLGIAPLMVEYMVRTPMMSFMHGLIYTLLVIGVTYPLTRNNYYWKS